MLNRFAVITFMMLGFILLPVFSNAQERTQETQSLLPEIDPQDIEIRSQFRARFPGLRRQPILGFNPRPRIFMVDPNRMPFMETEEQIMANLPIGEVSRPDAPEYSVLPYNRNTNGYAVLAIGNYITPEADVWAAAQIGQYSWVSSSLNYVSSSGHLSDSQSSFRNLDWGTRFRGKIGRATVLGLEFGVFSDFNRMFLLDDPIQTTLDGASKKDYLGFRFGTDIQNFKNSIEGWSASLNGYTNSIDLNASASVLTSDAQEWGLNAGGNYTWAGNRIHETMSAGIDVNTGNYTISDDISNTFVIAGAYGRYNLYMNYHTDLKGKLGLYFVEDGTDTAFYPAGSVKVTHSFIDELLVRASVSASPEHSSLMDKHRENRFLSPDQTIRHTYRVDALAEVEAELFTGSSVKVGVSFSGTKNHAYYSRDENVPGFTESGYYTLNFENATTLRLFGGFTQQLLPRKLWLDAEASISTPQLKSGIDIPFEERFRVTGALSYKPIERLIFEAWTDFLGPRNNPVGGDLPSFLLIGTRVEVAITDKIGAFAKISNLLNQNYEIWQGFEERPFQAFGGITVIF